MQKKAVFDKLYFPNKPNYEYTAEYFASKAAESFKYAGGYNPGDCVERNVAITNYVVQRQLAKTSKKLENKRKDYNDKRNLVEEQWEDLRTKEASFRNNFISFNQFVKENQEKKERAEHKIIEQNQLRDERQKRTEELMKQCEAVSEIKAKMDKRIAQYRIYESYLVEVVETEESMQSINDLIKRYEALIGAKRDLNDMQQRDMMKLERAKTDLMKLIEDKNFIIMGLNNQIANLQARYENANIKALESEELVTQIKNNAVKQLNEIDTVKNSVWNLYIHMASSKKHPIKIKKENVEEQMMYVNRTLTELNKVNKLIKKRAAKLSK
ncbi:unnamed protein product [Ceutorhynchus assimilis]|uniref:DUF4200 domain-containing protein n=1 Tax=Ceutorhynchus assimilis TaxID=467358 RepID=A0A9P0DIN7_9CUCU|nr:unnamed protein product [Ceutorhynchus assimilis]